MKHMRLITILIVVLVLLLSLLLPVTVLADNDKPQVPHHNLEDKTVPANCHSKHAREAGLGCDNNTDDGTPDTDTRSVPNSPENQLPKQRTAPDYKPVTSAPGLVTGLKWGCGGRNSVHFME